VYFCLVSNSLRLGGAAAKLCRVPRLLRLRLPSVVCVPPNPWTGASASAATILPAATLSSGAVISTALEATLRSALWWVIQKCGAPPQPSLPTSKRAPELSTPTSYPSWILAMQFKSIQFNSIKFSSIQCISIQFSLHTYGVRLGQFSSVSLAKGKAFIRTH
jgi:hypothetical protein